jgi:hypothetical protein
MCLLLVSAAAAGKKTATSAQRSQKAVMRQLMSMCSVAVLTILLEDSTHHQYEHCRLQTSVVPSLYNHVLRAAQI